MLPERNVSFRRLIAAQAISQLGDWLYNVALLALVFDRTHSSAWLGATTAARVLPIVLLGPVAGLLGDRFDRRLIMIAQRRRPGGVDARRWSPSSSSGCRSGAFRRWPR